MTLPVAVHTIFPMPKRYEKEIEEILGRAGTLRPRPAADYGLPTLLARYAANRLGRAGRLSSGLVMAAGLAMVIASLIVTRAAEGAGQAVLVAGLSALAAGYGLAFVPSVAAGSRPRPKVWRGRPIEPDTEE